MLRTSSLVSPPFMNPLLKPIKLTSTSHETEKSASKVHLKNSKYQGHVPGIWNLKKNQMLFDIFTVLKKQLIHTKKYVLVCDHKQFSYVVENKVKAKL